jgi:hypothetical protein
LKRP